MLRLYTGFVEQPRRAAEDDARAKEEGKAWGVWKPGEIQGYEPPTDPRRKNDGLAMGASIES